MIKHTNPFHTINEAISILGHMGARPYDSTFGRNVSDDYWTEHILSIRAAREYNDHYEFYFQMEIHIDREGFQKLVDLTGLNIMRKPHSPEYDMLSVFPGTYLEVFALVPKEETES